MQELRKLARVKVVDNSALAAKVETTGRPARIIHVYNKKQVAGVGDKVLLAIGGEKKQAYIVGVRKRQKPLVPTYDMNMAVLIEPTGVPSGTRVTAPLPLMLRKRKGDFTKIFAIATHFVW